MPKSDYKEKSNRMSKPSKRQIDSDSSDVSLDDDEINSAPPSKKSKSGKGNRGDDGSIYFNIEALRRVTVRNFKGRVYVDIREFYEKDGKENPGRKGISLSRGQWEKLKNLSSDIDEALAEII